MDKESIKETEWKDIKTEWKDTETESVKTWEFKVNGKDHTLSLTISPPNEKGYRKVSLVFK
ncbi:MAG: hypothetical protein QXK21_01280 [Candidatus Micrarchaeia archaeon]